MSVPVSNLRALTVDPLQLPGIAPSSLTPDLRSYFQDLHVSLAFWSDEVIRAVNDIIGRLSAVSFVWTGTELALYVDGFFIGYVSRY